MRSILRAVKGEKYIRQLISLSLLLVLCLECNTSFSDPRVAAIREVLQNESKDPETACQVMGVQLSVVEDKQIIPVLLDYLASQRYKQVVLGCLTSSAIAYLVKTSGINTRAKYTPMGIVYMDTDDLEQDVSQWRQWWNTNKDHLVWDEQSSKLKVVRP